MWPYATGCSTLDLLQRPTIGKKDESTWAAEIVAEAHKIQMDLGRFPDKRHNEVQSAANISKQGDRLKQRFVHGTPITRKLKCGRFVRVDGKDELSGRLVSSLSAPELPAVDLCSLYHHDALDEVIKESIPNVSKQQQLAPLVTNNDSGMNELQSRKQELEDELLRITKKLCRKYNKNLFPAQPTPVSKIHELADRWRRSGKLSESEQHQLYMDGRFTTQQQADFYPRDLEPRGPANDKHRRHTMHTMYGDALFRNRHSLRSNF